MFDQDPPAEVDTPASSLDYKNVTATDQERSEHLDADPKTGQD
jgi:hypothetical protein